MQLLAFFNAALPSLYGTPSISYCLLKDSKINECAVNYSKRKHLLSWLVCQRSAQHKEHLIISSVAFHELIYHYFIPFSCLLWARHWFQIDNSIVSAIEVAALQCNLSIQRNFIHTQKWKTYQTNETMMRDLVSHLHKIMLIRRTRNAEWLRSAIVFQFTCELMDNIHLQSLQWNSYSKVFVCGWTSL